MSVVAKKATRAIKAIDVSVSQGAKPPRELPPSAANGDVIDISVNSEKKSETKGVTPQGDGVPLGNGENKRQLVCAIKDSTGNCVRLAENRATAEQFVMQQSFAEALASCFGPDAMTKFRAALVTPDDALKKVFGDTAIGKVNEAAAKIKYTIVDVPADDMKRIISQLEIKS
jgi:hypothetical protein